MIFIGHGCLWNFLEMFVSNMFVKKSSHEKIKDTNINHSPRIQHYQGNKANRDKNIGELSQARGQRSPVSSSNMGRSIPCLFGNSWSLDMIDVASFISGYVVPAMAWFMFWNDHIAQSAAPVTTTFPLAALFVFGDWSADAFNLRSNAPDGNRALN